MFKDYVWCGVDWSFVVDDFDYFYFKLFWVY